jgi:hypothetical protein
LIYHSLFVPIDNEWDKKSHAPGEEDDTASETEDIAVRQALHDEKDSTHQKQEPTQEVKSFFCLIDVSAP